MPLRKRNDIGDYDGQGDDHLLREVSELDDTKHARTGGQGLE